VPDRLGGGGANAPTRPMKHVQSAFWIRSASLFASCARKISLPNCNTQVKPNPRMAGDIMRKTSNSSLMPCSKTSIVTLVTPRARNDIAATSNVNSRFSRKIWPSARPPANSAWSYLPGTREVTHSCDEK
jgi:hypothetical protein